VNLNFSAGLLREPRRFNFNHCHALIEIKERPFITIDRHPDDQTIHQCAPPPDDINMSEGDRIKGSGVKAYAHLNLSDLISVTSHNLSELQANAA
jgi:hypothetical protein